MAINLDGYVDVAERIREFRAKYPEGSLQPADREFPFKIETVGGKEFVVYVAAAYRTPDDARPGIGVAWEPFPGKTAFTRDSELMNAETSAWGRAIVASLAGDTQRVASAEEVRNRAGDASTGDGEGGTSTRSPAGPVRTAPSSPARTTKAATEKQVKLINMLVDRTGLVPETWPLPDDLSAAAASKLIDWLQDTPKEDPAERVASLRKDADQAATEFVGQ